ncbi:hypothetical protein B0T18DRAFT_69955 [Schizothecium vesticola]|uniref:Uncharacterized protein n=1 Tax=Schizothecium vesticola TaxID=314040 RepID=A0AA40F5C8_9PEZI|nr:hypothetical protein B0T18DRAFT_69955 [Schizothecium vesticola]
MLDTRDADPRRVAAHPVVYSRRRSPQVEWRDVTRQQPLDPPRRQSPSVEQPPSTIQADAKVDDEAKVAGEEAAGCDSSTTSLNDARPVSPSRQTDSADMKGGSGHEITGDTPKQDAVDRSKAVVSSKGSEAASSKDSEAVGPKDSEDKLDSQGKESQADTSAVVIDAHITMPLPAPSKGPDGVGSSGGSDTGRGEASSSSAADSREDLVHKGLVDFFSKLAVDWSKKTGKSTASTEPASTVPGVSAALEVLRKLILDFIKLYRRLVRRFEDQTQTLAGWAEDATLDTLWADMVKSYFCERGMGQEGFKDGAIMISSCQQTLQNAIAKAQDNSKRNGDDYRVECEVRVAKKCLVCCDGIVELAKRAERERIACQHLIHELKDARDLLHKWMGKLRLRSSRRW